MGRRGGRDRGGGAAGAGSRGRRNYLMCLVVCCVEEIVEPIVVIRLFLFMIRLRREEYWSLQ